MRISDWSSDVCSSDLHRLAVQQHLDARQAGAVLERPARHLEAAPDPRSRHRHVQPGHRPRRAGRIGLSRLAVQLQQHVTPRTLLHLEHPCLRQPTLPLVTSFVQNMNVPVPTVALTDDYLYLHHNASLRVLDLTTPPWGV